jgi:hypothetical protein
MDTINKDNWSEIVLSLDIISAMRLRRTSTFFAFMNDVYFIVLEEETISCRRRGKLHGWLKHVDDSDICGHYIRYDNGLIVEQYRVMYMPNGAIIQINDVIYFDTHFDLDSPFRDHGVDLLDYDGPLISMHPLPCCNTCLVPEPSDKAYVLAISQNFLNLRDREDVASMFVLELLQRDCLYCLNCHKYITYDSTFAPKWSGCCKYADTVSWQNNQEAILASLKINRPRVYALLPHEKLALSIHE